MFDINHTFHVPREVSKELYIDSLRGKRMDLDICFLSSLVSGAVPGGFKSSLMGWIDGAR